jgi:oligoribonuclease
VQGIFVDIESNGLDCFRHKVIEVAFKVIRLDTGKIEASFESSVNLSDDEWQLSDPQSLVMNGMLDRMCLGKSPSRKEVGEKIQAIFKSLDIHREDSVFICQNPSFDRPFFAQLIDTYTQERNQWPYRWLDLASMFWANQASLLGLPKLNRLSKDHIAAHFSLEKEASPHRAMAGVEHLIVCYEKVIGWPAKRMCEVMQSSSSARSLV